jgi:hypothetical protein
LFFNSDGKEETLSSVQTNILSQARQHRKWHEKRPGRNKGIYPDGTVRYTSNKP